MTQLAEEFSRKMAPLASKSGLYLLATDELKRVDGDVVMARRRFWKTVSADTSLLMALLADQFGMDEQALTDGALKYLQARKSDMARGPDELPGKGQKDRDTQSLSAQPAVPPIHDGEEGQMAYGAQSAIAQPVVDPSPARLRAERQAANVVALTVYDRRMSNGQILGNLYWGSLQRMRATSAREAALYRLLLNYGQVADPNAKVRDVVSEQDLQRMIQKAAELSDAM